MTFVPVPNQITAITNASPAVVTTATNHNYNTGEMVRLLIPNGFGMTILNNTVAIITVLSATTFSLQYSQNPFVNLSTLNFNPFVIPSGAKQNAQVIPIGSGATPISNTPVQVINNASDSLINNALSNNSTIEIPF